MEKPKIIFRADGNEQIGLGHVYRCLALADMLKDQFECIFATCFLKESIIKDILISCSRIIELPEEDTHYNQFLTLLDGSEIVVLDNYFYHTDYQKAIMAKGCSLVHIDDMQPYHYVANAVINHAPGLDDKLFSKESYTHLYTGLSYSLLRRPFLEAALEEGFINLASDYRIFVCFGGSDMHNVTMKVLIALHDHPLVGELHVVSGSANPYFEELQNTIANVSNTYLYHHLSAQDMVGLMKKCNLAIVPASSILYEVTAARLFAISGYYVDNQANIYEGFLKEGLIKGVGNFLSFDAYNRLIDEITFQERERQFHLQMQKLKGDVPANFVRLFKELVYENAKISE